MDISVGLPYFDLTRVPLSIAQKFPFLRESRESVLFPRIYFVCLAIDSLTKACDDDASAVRVVVVAQNAVIVADPDSGKICRVIKFASDIVAAFSVVEEEKWFAIMTERHVAGGDAVLQLPVVQEREMLHRCVTALYAFHTQRTLVIQHATSAADLRARAEQRPCSSTEEHALQAAVDAIPMQMWAVVNLSVPVVTDRMAHVKSRLTDVEHEMKADAVAASRELEREQSSMDRVLAALREAISVEVKQLEKQRARERSICEEEAELRTVREGVDEREREMSSLKVDFATAEQDWRRVSKARCDEELQEKQRLVKQQGEYNRTLTEHHEEADSLQHEIDGMAEQLFTYDSQEYAEAVSARDAAAAELRIEMIRLDDLRSAQEERKKRQLADRSADALATNEALRKLLAVTHASIANKSAEHDKVKEDIDGLIDDIQIFEDQDLLTLAQERDLTVKIRATNGALAATESEMQKLQAHMDSSRDQRRFYYASKARLEDAIGRRRKVEHTSDAQRIEMRAKRMDIQQQLFAERLRLDAELKRRVS